DGGDGRGGLVVEDRLPGDAAVGGLPDAAGGGAGVVDERVAGDAGRAADAAAGERADQAVLRVLEDGLVALVGLVVLVRAGRGGGREGGQGGEQDEGPGAKSVREAHAGFPWASREVRRAVPAIRRDGRRGRGGSHGPSRRRDREGAGKAGVRGI